MNPLEAYDQAKVAQKTQRKQHELDLWQHWRDNGEQPEHLAPLLKLYEPVFSKKMAWKAPMVPAAVFKAELQGHAIRAFKSYDPNRGTALNTHVENNLIKAQRYNNKYQNTAYIPEGKSRYIGHISRAKDALTDELNREPTNEEIHAHMLKDPDHDFRKLTPKLIGEIQKGQRRDIPAGMFAGAEEFDYTPGSNVGGRGYEQQQIALAAEILPDIFPNKPVLHAIFNHTFGTNGYQKILRTGALAKKLGLSESQVARHKTVLGNTLKKYMQPSGGSDE
jgi:hypothetical protein